MLSGRVFSRYARILTPCTAFGASSSFLKWGSGPWLSH